MSFPRLTAVLEQVGWEAPAQAQLDETLASVLQLITQFRNEAIEPVRCQAFERQLEAQLRQLGRELVQWTYNHLETEPARPVDFAGQTFRFCKWSPRRQGLDTLFGTIRLRRRLYEQSSGCSRRILCPLDHQLGISDRRASPALAERVAQQVAEASQRQVLDWLVQHHQVHWSHRTLRRVVERVARDVEPQRLDVLSRQVLRWLAQAKQSRGRHRPVLAVGRDGIHVPACQGRTQEGAVATVTVYDRRSRRLGTVYLGRMYVYQQEVLSQQLTALLTAVLQASHDPLPQLCYVTDGGWHPQDYFTRVLRRWRHPRTGQRLAWTRILDFYHAISYLRKLAEALFGVGTGEWWVRTYCRVLRDAPKGVLRVLRSAAGFRAQASSWTAEQEALYQEGYRYLRRFRRSLRYATYRQQGFPLGSGVTEAACKRVFTERLKRSGMRWSLSGGQVVLDLRTLVLSGVWDAAYAQALAAKPQPHFLPAFAPAVKSARKTAA